MIRNLEIVCKVNDSLREDVGALKRQKRKLEKVIKEKDNDLETIKKKLVDSKVVLKKFGSQSEKLDEILASRRFEPRHRGFGYINKA
ncbi:hypothetical protein J1N35_004199 [Gossypium stocksii]|uniref:Uncharacterized protein n=1 Tax=Gossypium stocksii TaxID=47602 RepID=A0A9D4AHF8_9ROSI|nr:hypothetical protein J1N35_004199 [Gossypium stocksii]